MKQTSATKPDYGNWVSSKFIYVPGAICLLFLGTSLLSASLLIPALIFLAVAIYFAYARRLFAARGGYVQDRIRDLVLDHLDWNGEGRALDIGCGNGALTIKVAQRHVKAVVTGCDHWGGKWEYSKAVCERNAEVEGVDDRVSFQKASASKLPFEDGHFDAAVSNLVFHEVSDTKDKREVVREALRVVREGGRFAFQDLFLLKRLYGETDELLATIRSWGIRKAEFIKTSDAPFIPATLKLPFMVGAIGIIQGEK
jgi:SAM-dependent methyltransferase